MTSSRVADPQGKLPILENTGPVGLAGRKCQDCRRNERGPLLDLQDRSRKSRIFDFQPHFTQSAGLIGRSDNDAKFVAKRELTRHLVPTRAIGSDLDSQ